MELTWIDDFLALNRTRNFTRAAAARHTTQSAYSRRIQRLEEWLGAPLCLRDTRPVTLTPAGEEFAARAARLREDIFDARRAVLAAASHFKKAPRIYTTNTLASNYIAGWLAARGIETFSLMVASIAGCIEGVRRGHADIALIPDLNGETDWNGLTAETVGADRLTLVSANAQIALRRGKLCGPIMAYTPGTSYGARIDALLKQRKIRIEQAPVCESASTEALLAQVKAGLGAAWIPHLLLKDSSLERCAVPAYFDIPYEIVALTPGDQNPSRAMSRAK